MKTIPVTIQDKEASISLTRQTIRFRDRHIVTYLLRDLDMREIESRIQPIIEEIAQRRMREIDDQAMRDIHCDQ